jgi:hypothetical protein
VRVYFGSWGFFDLYRTDAKGQVTIPASPNRVGAYWTKSDSGPWISQFLANDQVNAESADGKLADVFTTQGLIIVRSRGLVAFDYDRVKEQNYSESPAQDAVGLQKQLQYDVATGALSLRMKLLPKAVVTGRVRQSSGVAFDSGEIYVLPMCAVRPLEERMSLVGCFRMGNARLLSPKEGETYDLFGNTYFPSDKDGAFRIEVPAGKPFILVFQPANVKPMLGPWAYPAKDTHTGKTTTLPELKPGGVRDLGDITPPPATQPAR